MAKKVRIVLTLQLPAGKATPAPPVGTALGPHGINIVEFTKSYNEKTADKVGQVIPAQITVFEDRSFTFVLKTPPAADLLRKAAGDRQGRRDGRPRDGRHGHAGPGPRDRGDQDGRSQRQRHRGGDAPDRGHRAQHGHRGQSADARKGDHTRRLGRSDPGPATASPRTGEAADGRQGETWRSTARSTRRRRSSSSAITSIRPPRPSRSPRRRPSSASTRRSRPTCASAWIPVTPTRWCAAPSSFPRHRQARPRRRLRPGREGPGGAPRRRRRSRRRGPRQEDRGRLARIRRRPRDAGHDGPGRPPRQDPRPPRPHAEPEGGHDHVRHRACGQEVKAGRVEFRVDKGAIIHVSIGKVELRARRARPEPRDARRRDQPGAPERGQGPVHEGPDDREHDGTRHQGGPSGSARGSRGCLDVNRACGRCAPRSAAAGERVSGSRRGWRLANIRGDGIDLRVERVAWTIESTDRRRQPAPADRDRSLRFREPKPGVSVTVGA